MSPRSAWTPPQPGRTVATTGVVVQVALLLLLTGATIWAVVVATPWWLCAFVPLVAWRGAMTRWSVLGYRRRRAQRWQRYPDWAALRACPVACAPGGDASPRAGRRCGPGGLVGTRTAWCDVPVTSRTAALVAGQLLTLAVIGGGVALLLTGHTGAGIAVLLLILVADGATLALTLATGPTDRPAGANDTAWFLARAQRRRAARLQHERDVANRLRPRDRT